MPLYKPIRNSAKSISCIACKVCHNVTNDEPNSAIRRLVLAVYRLVSKMASFRFRSTRHHTDSRTHTLTGARMSNHLSWIWMWMMGTKGLHGHLNSGGSITSAFPYSNRIHELHRNALNLLHSSLPARYL